MVSVHDAYPAPLVTTKVMGQSNQITTTGKNLMRLINSGTVNGVNLTANGDGSYHVKGTQTAGFTRFYTDDGIKKPLAEFGLKVGDTVYLSAAEASAKLYMAIFFWDEKGSNVYTQVATSANVTKYTIAENVTQAYVCISLDGSVGTSVDSDFHPMISLNSNKDWEPYTGGKPSPSPDYPQEITNLNKAELVITGKNLINPNRLAQIDSSYYQAVDGQLKVINSHNAAWKDVPIYGTLQAGTYTLSGDNIEIRDTALNQIVNIMSTQVKQFTLNNPTAIKMKIGYGWPKYPVITKAQLEVGSKATACEPHKSKNTVIDLKGNELCSLPNGVKDEVVIDAEGNVSLIKRVGVKTFFGADDENWIQGGSTEKVQAFNTMALSSTYKASVNRYCNLLPFTNEKDTEYIAIDGVGKTYLSLNKARTPTLAEFKSFLSQNPLTVIYEMKTEPQTIPLGKVELPALPEATSNVWNDGNIPANVYIQYLKDVNIAYSDLENQIKQITAALSVMDTPTVIPEMAWGTPAAI